MQIRSWFEFVEVTVVAAVARDSSTRGNCIWCWLCRSVGGCRGEQAWNNNEIQKAFDMHCRHGEDARRGVKWHVTRDTQITHAHKHTRTRTHVYTHTCTRPYPRCKNQTILEYTLFGYMCVHVDTKVEPSPGDQEWRRITRQSSRFSKKSGSCLHVLKFGFCRIVLLTDPRYNRMYTNQYFFVKARGGVSVYTRSTGAMSHVWCQTRAHTSDCTQYYCLTLSGVE